MKVKVRPVIGRPIPLGHQGEHLARRVDFGDLIEFFEELWPGGTPTIWYQRPGDTTCYEPANVDTTTGLVWTPTNIDTEKAGNGSLELRWSNDETIVKSYLWDVTIKQSLVNDGESPEDHEYYTGEYVVTPNWQEQILETNNKICTDDIHVLEIQASETMNAAGGLTLSI